MIKQFIQNLWGWFNIRNFMNVIFCVNEQATENTSYLKLPENALIYLWFFLNFLEPRETTALN